MSSLGPRNAGDSADLTSLSAWALVFIPCWLDDRPEPHEAKHTAPSRRGNALAHPGEVVDSGESVRL